MRLTPLFFIAVLCGAQPPKESTYKIQDLLNPDAREFQLGISRDVSPPETPITSSKGLAPGKNQPIVATKLLELEKVLTVVTRGKVVTVIKTTDSEWDRLMDAVVQIIQEQLHIKLREPPEVLPKIEHSWEVTP